MRRTKRPQQSDDRGQTEPLAALVAVAILCLVVSAYAGFVTGLVPDLRSDRQLAEVTAERVWESISDEGIYPADTALADELSPEDLPRGQQVSLNVTSVGEEGHVTEQSQAQFDETGSPTPVTVTQAGETFERPIAVQHRDGDIRPGLLTVVVSDGQ